MRLGDKLRHARAYVWYMRDWPLPRDRHHVLIAAFQKSGSTYLGRVIDGLPGFETVSLVTAFDRREQELSVECLAAYHHFDYVARHHVRYSEPTRMLLDRFGVFPIVLVRNLFDVVVSTRDHLRRESTHFPMAYCTEAMVDWDDAELHEFIVEMIVPWYFNFYVGWQDCPDRLQLRYEDVTRDICATMRTITARAGIPATDRDIEQAIEASGSKFTRKNVGIAGRGEAELSDRLKDRIRGMTRYYPGVDFSPIGLG